MSFRGCLSILSAMVIFSLLASMPACGEIIYVNAAAPGPTHDGTTWATAYQHLQDALSRSPAYGDEIWVAAGIYTPDPNGLTDPREASFQMINGVAIYGGFPAGGEAVWADRDPNMYVTILSGDLLGNDDPATPVEDLLNDPNRADNCYHVFYHPEGLALDPNAVLDGFIVTGGNTNVGIQNDGGGMFNYGSSPTVTGCTFMGNSAYDGGGMYNYSSNPTVVHCIFSDNDRSGMCNYSSSPKVTSCTFSGNSAYEGGGMYNNDSSPTVTNCTFSGSWTMRSGGGMYNVQESSPIVANCTFTGNTVGLGNGGGMLNGANSCPVVTNCTFSGNRAMRPGCGGGGMYNHHSSPVVTSCMFSGNSAGAGGAMCNSHLSSPTVTGSILWGNTASYDGNEVHNFDASCIPVISYCDIASCGGSGVGWDVSLGSDGGGNIDADPLFADSNNGDYHLKSQAGRWDPNTAGWVKDAVTSRCIDAGNPGSPLGDELADPNNLRINMSAYGGTAQASKTPAGWSLLADLTNDGTADLEDLVAQCQYWVGTESELPGDLNRDGVVDLADLKLLTLDWLEHTVWFGT